MSRTDKHTEIPGWLKHKPIYAIKRYEQVDGFYKNDTDVIGLSLGKAQWCDNDFVPSVKVWRDVKVKGTNCYKISCVFTTDMSIIVALTAILSIRFSAT